MLCIFIEYSIDCAHWLPFVPDGHKCGKMHGHRYDIRLEVAGAPDRETGWIIDYADVRKIADPIIMGLDHKTLNEFPGLTNPTCENLVLYLCDNLQPKLPELSKIEVRETGRAGCIWRHTYG